MATNLALDDSLILEAKTIGGHRTKREAVTQALVSYIQHKKQIKTINLFGKMEFDPDYDYKKQRNKS